MTAPTRRQPRAARARPPGRAPRTRPGPLPTTEVRRRRGPKPPDHVVRALERALAEELAAAPEAATAVGGAIWWNAVAAATGALPRAARRGVASALAGTGAVRLVREAPYPPGMRAWSERLTENVRAAIDGTRDSAIMEDSTQASLAPSVATCECCRSDTAPLRADALVGRALAALRAGAAAIALAVLREHARLVQWFARRAGSARYIWTTMRDERVRQLHRELEGTVQRWDSPPLAGLPAFFGHPGEAAGPCRCQAFPLP
jgi:hypothetical protein